MQEHLVERAFVISLIDRPERLKNFYANLPETTWMPKPEVWHAVKGDACVPPDNWSAGNGAWGCMRSHMAITEYCLNNRVGSYIVFEDDAQFDERWDDAETFMRALPDDWQLAYLGGQLVHANSHWPLRIGDGVLRPYNVNRTHCFAVSRDGMLPIYQHCMRLPYEFEFHIDHHLGRWHEDARNKVYCPDRWLVGQHGFSSSISGKHEKIQFYRDPVKYLKNRGERVRLCVLYRANPSFINEARAFLHFGNQVARNGCDPELNRAAELKRPHRVINYWWGYVSGEVVKSDRLPAMYQPELDEATMRDALPGVEFVTIDHVSSIEDLEEQVAAIRENAPVQAK